MKYELPSTELIVIEENNYLKFGEYLNDMQCDNTANKLNLDDLEYVRKLKQENKILRENAEHNDKVVDKVNWGNQLLKKKNQQLQERIEYLERSNNRREDTIFEQRQEISDLEDNWDKLKEYLINDINNRNGNRVVECKKGAKVVEYEDSRTVIETISPIYTLMEDKSKTMKEILDKMQEIERSDSNE